MLVSEQLVDPESIKDCKIARELYPAGQVSKTESREDADKRVSAIEYNKEILQRHKKEGR